MQAAGSAFGTLFKGSAGGAVEGVVPALLSGLEGAPDQAAQALEGLRVILSVRPQALSSMVPRLLRPPLQPPAVRALGSLAEVAGKYNRSLLAGRCQPSAYSDFCMYVTRSPI